MFPAMRNRWVTFDCHGTLVPSLPAKAHGRLTSEGKSLPAEARGRLASEGGPFNDVESLLAELRLRGYKLGVLTNCDDAQFEAAHRTFRKPFDLFVTAERIRALKPDLWHFRAFQRLAQVRKNDWVHIAADWRRDIVPAEVFGIHRVWLDRDGTGEDPSRAAQPRRVGPRTRTDQSALLGVGSLCDPTGEGGTAHVHTAADAVRAVDWLFQDQAVRAS